MKILIVYNSQTGFTREYAQELAKRVSGEATALRDAHRSRIGHPDIILFGSRAHVGSIERLRRGAALMRASGAPHQAIFVTGAAPADAAKQIQALWDQNLPKENLENLPHFYLPAGLRYEAMGRLDQFLMSGLKMALRSKRNKTDEDRALEQSIASSFDISSMTYLEPIVEWVRQQEQ